MPARALGWLEPLASTGMPGAAAVLARADTAVAQLALLMVPGWAVKQVANVAQLWGSCQALVGFDFPDAGRRQKRR